MNKHIFIDYIIQQFASLFIGKNRFFANSIEYDLYIQPDRQKQSSNGSVNILILDKGHVTIVLEAKELLPEHILPALHIKPANHEL